MSAQDSGVGAEGNWQALGPYLNVFVGLGFFLLPSVSCVFKAGTNDYGALLGGLSPLRSFLFPRVHWDEIRRGV